MSRRKYVIVNFEIILGKYILVADIDEILRLLLHTIIAVVIRFNTQAPL